MGVPTLTVWRIASHGSRYKQRYFTKRGGDYFPLPAQWDVVKNRWLGYHVEAGTDWRFPF